MRRPHTSDLWKRADVSSISHVFWSEIIIFNLVNNIFSYIRMRAIWSVKCDLTRPKYYLGAFCRDFFRYGLGTIHLVFKLVYNCYEVYDMILSVKCDRTRPKYYLGHFVEISSVMVWAPYIVFKLLYNCCISLKKLRYGVIPSPSRIWLHGKTFTMIFEGKSACEVPASSLPHSAYDFKASLVRTYAPASSARFCVYYTQSVVSQQRSTLFCAD